MSGGPTLVGLGVSLHARDEGEDQMGCAGGMRASGMRCPPERASSDACTPHVARRTRAAKNARGKEEVTGVGCRLQVVRNWTYVVSNRE